MKTEIPNIIETPKRPTAQELLMNEELFLQKEKSIKFYKMKIFFPTNTSPSTDGVNILKNILNYPETKRILGVSLTSDLKEKNKEFRLCSVIWFGKHIKFSYNSQSWENGSILNEQKSIERNY